MSSNRMSTGVKVWVSSIIGATLLACSASAADTITVATSADDAVPIHGDDLPIDWTGFYAGVYGAATIGSPALAEIGIGLQLGVNAQFDFLLVGAEVNVQGLSGDVGNTVEGQILGRAGLVATDDVVVYGAGGYGLDLGGNSQGEALLGGGVELALSDTVSLNARYLRSFPKDGLESDSTISFGANFHF